MSRNFELLRRLGQDIGDSEPPLRPMRVDTSAAPAPSLVTPPTHKPRIERHLLEEMEHLVQQVFIVPAKAAPAVVTFADVEAHPHATNICARVADVLGAQTRSVCVIDANAESPTVHGYFGLSNERGFADAMREPYPIASFGYEIEGGSLTVIPAGETGDLKASSMFSTDVLAARMMELRKQFRYVLIQGQPLRKTSDSTLLGQYADGLILVIDANTTRRDLALRAKEELDRARVKVLGSVLAKSSAQGSQSTSIL